MRQASFHIRMLVYSILIIAISLVSKAQPRPAPGLPTSISPISVLESTANRLVMRVVLGEMTLQPVMARDGNTYATALVNAAGIADIGKPQVPTFGYWILIPNGKAVEVQVNPGAPQVRTDVLLNPVQIPEVDSEGAEMPPFQKDETTYQTDADYPGVFARLEPRQFMRGQQLAMLRIFPYQHNAVQRSLKSYADLEISITFSGQIEPIPGRLLNREFDLEYRRLAINADAVLAAEQEAASGLPLIPAGRKYLIITHSSLVQAANTLAAWRTKMGYNAYVQVIPNTWKAPDLRKALATLYQSWNSVPVYILILGDAEHVPTNYYSTHSANTMSINGQTNTQGPIGTDFFYSTLDAYNANDAFADLTPDVYLGRIPVEDAASAMQRVTAIINYEKSPLVDPNFYNTFTVAAQFQDEKSAQSATTPDGIEDRMFTQSAEDLALFLASSPQDKTIKRIYYASSLVNPTRWNDNNQQQGFHNYGSHTLQQNGALPSYLKRPTFLWNGSSMDVTNAVNAGTFLLVHRDHGARDHWGKPSFANYDARHLNNQSRLPVVWSINCETGWFDNETDFPTCLDVAGQCTSTPWKDLTGNDEPSLAEQLGYPTRALLGNGDYGALGVIAATRISYSGINEFLLMGMAKAIWPDYYFTLPSILKPQRPVYRMGAVLNLGKKYMTQYIQNRIVGGSDIWLETLQIFHWFGDPASEIRTETPSLLLANFPVVWANTLHPQTLMLQVDKQFQPAGPSRSGGDRLAAVGPLEGAQVCISKPDAPMEYWTGYTDVEGKAIFPDLTTSFTGQYDVVVTAPNSVPFIGALESVPGQAGGVKLEQVLYSCNSPIQIRVADSDLKNTGALDVSVTSSNGDMETATLIETPAGSGFFIGGIDGAPGAAHPGDHILQVQNQGTITASYTDANDGNQRLVLVQSTAKVDCQAPVFAGISQIRLAGGVVQLGWNPAQDENAPIFYTIYRSHQSGEPIGENLGETMELFFHDTGCRLGETCFYTVRARDASFNQDNNLVQRSVTLWGLYLPLIAR